MPAAFSKIYGLNQSRLPPAGISVNTDEGTLAYQVDGEGAVIHLTPEDAWTLAQGLLQYCTKAALLGRIAPSGNA